MNLPKRRKPQKLGLREAPQIRSAGHLRWCRGFECAAKTSGVVNALASSPINCQGRIEAAHVRSGTDGGTSLKPSDCWVIPLCAFHHFIQHQVGEAEFERIYKIDMKKTAAELWRRSPHRHKHQPPTD